MVDVAHSLQSGADLHVCILHASTHEPGGSDALAVDAAAGTGSLRSLGTTASKAAAGNHTVPAFVGSGGGHAAGHVPDPGASAGSVAYLCEDGTWSVPPGGGGGGGGTDLDIFETALNNESFTITKGQPVLRGSHTIGTIYPEILLADTTIRSDGRIVMGVAAADIASGANGLVQTAGVLAGIDTHLFGVGDPIYAGPGGTFQTTYTWPDEQPHRIGEVVTSDATTGSIRIGPWEEIPLPHSHQGFGDGGSVGAVLVYETAPSGNPPANTQYLYISPSDHKLYRRNSAGVDTLIG